jgi:hypothetical protein
VACSIAYILRNFGWLPEGIKHLETQGLSVQESMDIMTNAPTASVYTPEGIWKHYVATDNVPTYHEIPRIRDRIR